MAKAVAGRQARTAGPALPAGPGRHRLHRRAPVPPLRPPDPGARRAVGHVGVAHRGARRRPGRRPSAAAPAAPLTRRGGSTFREHGGGHASDTLTVGDDVELDDLVVDDGEGHDDVGLPVQRDDDAGGPVHQRGVEHAPPDRPRGGPGGRPPRHPGRPWTQRDGPGRSRPAGRRRGGARRPGRRSPRRGRPGRRRRPRRVAGRDRGPGSSAPRTRRRARLASCLAAVGDRSTMGAISSKGRSNMSWRTKARRSAGVSASSTTWRPGRPSRPAAPPPPVRVPPPG